MKGRTSDERGTPAYIVEAVREVMGAIDLDPASCYEANGIVKANIFFAKEDDGLSREWFGRVFLNPPFSQPLCQRFVGKLIDEHQAGRVSQAVIVCNVSTGRWYHSLLARYPVVFPKHHELHPNARIEFYPLLGNDRGTSNNSRGQAIFYAGKWAAEFYRVFGEFCTIPWRGR